MTTGSPAPGILACGSPIDPETAKKVVASAEDVQVAVAGAKALGISEPG